MKKIIAIMALALAFAGNIFADEPTFDDPNAYVVDTGNISGEMKNNVEITNVSTATNFEVKILGWHEVRKEWLEFGKTRATDRQSSRLTNTIAVFQVSGILPL